MWGSAWGGSTPPRCAIAQCKAAPLKQSEKENKGNMSKRKKPPDRRLVCLMEWTNKPYVYNRKPDNRKPDTESQTNKPPDREPGSPPHQRSSPLQPNKQASPETAFDPKLGHRKPCIRVICTVLLSVETAWPPKNPEKDRNRKPRILGTPARLGTKPPRNKPPAGRAARSQPAPPRRRRRRYSYTGTA